MQFSAIIGQADARQRLINMVQTGRVSHALLLLGKEGTGGLPLAMAFAQYLVCDEVNRRLLPPEPVPSLFADLPAAPATPPSWPADSCGQCSSCIKAAGLVHPDIHFSYPVISKKSGDKAPISSDYAAEWRSFAHHYPYGNAFDWLQSIGAENKQGNITARECDEINRKLSLKSFESGYKILIMWLPEYLQKEGNKLLKLIEEPPSDTILLLVAEEESEILPTILSRTQLVRIPPIHPEAIRQALIERSGQEPEKAALIAGIAAGNYREALALVQHHEEDWLTLVREWLNAILKNGPVAQVKWVEEMARYGREKQKHFLRYFNHLLQQSIRLRLLGTAVNAMPSEEYDFALRLNKLTGIAQQEAIIEETDKAAYYIERNANGKMLFQALSIKIYHIIKDNSLLLIQ